MNRELRQWQKELDRPYPYATVLIEPRSWRKQLIRTAYACWILGMVWVIWWMVSH